ncbi:unnamed protein product, partial [marine sediment metagenome]
MYNRLWKKNIGLKTSIILMLMILYSVFFVQTAVAVEPPGIEWENTFGGFLQDGGSSMDLTSDNGFIITGSTYSYGNGDYDIWLIKTDDEGNELWNKTFGGDKKDFGTDIEVTKDGGYIIVGTTFSYGNGDSDIWLIKTDDMGNLLWDKTFGGAEDDKAGAIQQTSDGGYIIAGESKD